MLLGVLLGVVISIASQTSRQRAANAATPIVIAGPIKEMAVQVEFSANDRVAVGWGRPPTKPALQVWGLTPPRRVFDAVLPSRAEIALSQQGDRVAAATATHLMIWHVTTKKLLKKATGLTKVPSKMAFTPDGRRLIALWYLDGKKGELRTTDVATGQLRQALTVGGHPTAELAASNDFIAFSPTPHAYALVDLSTFTISKTRRRAVTQLLFEPEGTLLAMNAYGSYNRIEPKTGKRLRRMQLGRHCNYFNLLTSKLSVCWHGPRRAKLRSNRRGAVAHTIKLPVRVQHSGFAVSQDSRWFSLQADDEDGTILVYAIAPHLAASTSPTGQNASAD